jgi:hypothetical protein
MPARGCHRDSREARERFVERQPKYVWSSWRAEKYESNAKLGLTAADQ